MSELTGHLEEIGVSTRVVEEVSDLERQLAEAQQESTDAIELMQAANAAATKLGRERDEAQGKLDAVEAEHHHVVKGISTGVPVRGCQVCRILKGE